MATKKLDITEIRIERTGWKKIYVEALSDDIRSIFEKRKSAVDLYIDGYSLADIKTRTGIDKTKIAMFVNKCIQRTNEGGECLGYAALLPYKRTIPYRRVKDSNIMNGHSGAFEKLLLDYPTLRIFIENQYFKKNGVTLEKNMILKTLHQKFLEECRRLIIQDYEYPFNTDNKGYKSLRLYVKKLKLQKPDDAIKRENKDVRQKYHSTGFGKKYSSIPLAPYSVVQLDGHKIDALYAVEVENDKGEIVYMPATRMWIIVVIDMATRCILGYSVTQEENYNQTDVLKAMQYSVAPHIPMELTVGKISYPENGGFPSTAIKETKWAMFDEIMLDNAKAHLAIDVVSKITSKLKCTINFGSVATPEPRGIVERVFKTLEDNGFHRLPSTTGSNIRDNKRDNAEKNAIKYKITYNDLVQLVEYFIALYNNSPHSALDNQSPLECMERRIKEALMLPYIADSNEKDIICSLTNLTVKRVVRGGIKNGKRPYVRFEGADYRNNEIALTNGLVGESITLEVNPKDISKIRAFLSNGEELGLLTAVGEWGRKPHSLKTRKLALNLARKNGKGKDTFYAPLNALEEELKERSLKHRKARTTANIIRNEQGPPSSSEEKKTNIKTTEKKIVNIEKKMQKLSDDQLEQLKNLSIEEAFERGVF